MRSSNMNSRVPEPVLSAEMHCGLQIESVLRIRPMLRKEREDVVLIEVLENTGNNGTETVVLNPLHPSLMSPVAGNSLRNRADSDSTAINVPVEYHFNHILPETSNQDKLYYTIGHPIASDIMKSLKTAAASRSYGPKETKCHLLICMGVVNSGKTYTCFGGTTIPKRRTAQDGLVPRLMDSLYSQSKHNTGGMSSGFAIQLSMIQVIQPTSGKSSIDTSACQVQDLLAFAKTKTAETPSKRNATVRNMAAKFERAVSSPSGGKSPKAKEEVAELNPDNPKPTIACVRDATQAREMLQSGLSASEKLSKGNQNFHLFVTLQPVIDGTKYGDKIVVLDMAGLEKEKRGAGISTRRADNVSSLNQTATAAVLRCLRVLTHNDNISKGKSNVIGFSGTDDDVSEISFVSQAKNPMKKQLKPVPFRQHKITMLMSPLFAKSSSVKVNLILAAYPGHSDLQQKRMLMQDVELLHGSSLVTPLATIVETGLDRRKPLSHFADQGIDDETTLCSADNRDPCEYENLGLPEHKLEKQVVVRAQPFSSNQSSAPKMPRHYSGVTSKAVRVPSKPRVQRQVQPSAPSCPEISTPQEGISDFPGVDIPSSIDRNKIKNNKRRSIEFARLERPTGRTAENQDYLNTDRDELHDIQDEAKSCNKPPNFCSSGNGRSPLEQLSIENLESRQKHDDKAASARKSKPTTLDNTLEQHTPQAEDRLYSALETSHTSNSDAQLQRLERRLQETMQEKDALARICTQLEKENSQLKNEVREAGRSVLQSKWTNQDEEEFMASRRMRREAQNLIKTPIQEHLEKVNYIYGIKNQWCMTNKRHFALQFPNQFQRAPALDLRDMAKKEAEIANIEPDDQHAIQRTQSADVRCVGGKRLSYGISKARFSLISPNKKTIPEPPKGLLKLKRLTARRFSNH
jgi:hypothetical protein